MSRAPRNAVAGLALAAAGVLYRRVTGRRPEPAEPPAAPPPAADPERVDAADVARARDELADELARRAAEKPR
ncbi:MAG: hypothetical protein ACXVRH_09210 [Thermoleophilaceae bacterium]